MKPRWGGPEAVALAVAVGAAAAMASLRGVNMPLPGLACHYSSPRNVPV